MKISRCFALALISSGAAFQAFAAPVVKTVPSTETPAQRAGRVAIAAAYAKMDIAMAKGNFAAPISVFAPNYSMRDTNDKVYNRAQSVAMLRNPPSVPLRFSKIARNNSFAWRDKDVKDIAVTNRVTALAKAGTGISAVAVKIVSQSRDLWTLTPLGWKIRQTVKIGRQAWANGKRVR